MKLDRTLIRGMAASAAFAGALIAETPEFLWELPTDALVMTSHALDNDGTVYLGLEDNAEHDSGPGRLLAVNPDGTEKWSFETGEGRGLSPAPILTSEDSILFGGKDGYLYSLDAQGGEQWNFSPGFDNVSIRAALGKDGAIFLVINRGLYAVSASGMLEWETQLENQASQPVIGADGMIYLYAGEFLFANRPDGSLHWRFEVEHPQNFEGPLSIGADGAIYAGVTAFDGPRLLAINADGSKRWDIALDAQGGAAVITGPDGAAYFGNGSGTLSAVDSSEGKVLWEAALADGGTLGIAASTEGPIIAVHQSGELIGLDWIGAELWKIEVAGLQGAPTIAPDGTIYTGSNDGTLRAWAGVVGPAESVWPTHMGGNRRTSQVNASGEIPPAPEHVRASQGLYPGGILIKWDSAPFAGEYEIWRSESSDAESATLLEESIRNAPHYFDSAVESGQSHFYWIKSENLVGTSEFSESAPGSSASDAGDGPWRFTADGSILYSSPAVGPEGVYISAAGEPHPATGGLDAPGRLYALDADGSLRWDFEINEYPYASPALGLDGTIYAATGKNGWITPGVLGILFALDPEGHEIWRFETPTLLQNTPAIGPDGAVFFGSALFYALNPDGTLRWEYEREEGGAITTPAAIAPDGTLYFGAEPGHVFALNSNGTLAWSYAHPDRFAAPKIPSAPALAGDGTICFPMGGDLVAFNPDGSVRWEFDTPGSIASGVTVGPEGTCYFGSGDGNLYAVHRDGTLKWKFPTDGPIQSTPALGADGTVYFGSDDGTFYTLNADGQLIQEYWTEGAINSSPALANGRVYFGSADRTVNALPVATSLSNGDWPMFGRDVGHSGSVAITEIPNPPMNVEANAAGGGGPVVVNWEAPSDLISFQIWRGTVDDPAQAELLADFIQGDSYPDETAGAGTRFYYWIKSRNAVGTGSFSKSATVVKPLPAEEGELIWSYQLDAQIHSSPAIGPDGTVYVGTGEEDEWIQQDYHFAAFDPNGTVKWIVPVADRIQGSPAVGEDGTAYVGSTDGTFYAFDSDGDVKWTHQAGRIYGSPAIGADGTVYFGSWDNHLYAFAPDGTERWRHRTQPDHTTGGVNSPAAVGGQGTIYFGAEDGLLHAVNADGTALWNFASGRSLTGAALNSDGAIYIGTGYSVNDSEGPGTFFALNTDGTERWRATTGPIRAAPAIGLDGTIYFGDEHHAFHAFSPNGTKQWEFTAEGPIKSSAAVSSGGAIYFGSSDGNLYALNPDGSQRWRFATEGPIVSSPAIGADGTIYVGSLDGNLYFIQGNGSKAESPWPMFQRDERRHARSAADWEAPSAPENVSASKGTVRGFVRVDWDSAPWAESYEVWRGDSADRNDAELLREIFAATSFEDRSAQFEVQYHYWIRARNALDAGPFSDPDSGFQNAVLWRFGLEGVIRASTAMASDGTLYIGAESGAMTALSPEGERLWDFLPGGGVGSSASIGADGTVYFGARDGHLYALNPQGNLKWRYETGDRIVSTPAISGDGRIYFGSNDGRLYAVGSDGELVWSHETGDRISAAPVVGEDGVVYVGSRGDQFYAFLPNGELKWSLEVGGGILGSAAIDGNGLIYFGSEDRNLYAVSPEGTIQWEYAASGPIHAAPAIGADGSIYFGCYHGNVYALSPEGQAKWIYESAEGTATIVVSTPAIDVSGEIYVGVASVVPGLDLGRLVALTPEGQSAWSHDAQDGFVQSSPLIGPDGVIYIGKYDGTLLALKGGTGLADAPWPKYQRDASQAGNLSTPPTSPPDSPEAPAATLGLVAGRIDVTLPEDRSSATYEIWRSPISELSEAERIADKLVGGAVFRDGSLPPNAEFWYWIRARNSAGASEFAGPTRGRSAAAYLKWIFTATSPFSTPLAIGHDGAAYAGVSNGRLLAVASDGNLKWEMEIGGPLESAPVVDAMGSIYVIAGDALKAVSAEGESLWEARADGERGEAFAGGLSPALTAEGSIVVAESEALAAFNSDGEIKWRSPLNARVTASPVIGHDGRIYTVSEPGRVHAIDASGAELWTAEPGGTIRQLAHGGRDVLYAGSEDDLLYALGLNQNGAVLWSFTGASGLTGTPVVAADGTAFIGGEGYIRNRDRRLIEHPFYAIGSDGENRWEFNRDTFIEAPAIVGEKSVCLVGHTELAVFDEAGELKWTLPLDAPTQRLSPPLATANGTVYFTADNHLYAVAGVEPLASAPWPLYRGDPQNSGRVSSGAEPPLRMAAELTDGGRIRITIAADPEASLVIEVSSDLETWKTATTLENGSEEAVYLDATNEERRFYRYRRE